MATTQTLPADPITLDKIYNEILDGHRVWLDKVHEAFNKQCETIQAEAEEKLKTVDENDKETRQKILDDQKQQLDKVLFELKQTVNKASKETMTRLEEIEQKKDELESAIIL